MPTVPTQIPNMNSTSLMAGSGPYKCQPLMLYSSLTGEAQRIAAKVAKLPELLRRIYCILGHVWPLPACLTRYNALSRA